VRQSRKKPRLKPLQKQPGLQKGQGPSGTGTYKEALTNIKTAIFRETYPEDKLMEDDQNCILEELGRVNLYIYIADQQSG
jgi:hypothetical protein